MVVTILFATSQPCWWQAAVLCWCCCQAGLLLVFLLVLRMILGRGVRPGMDGALGERRCREAAEPGTCFPPVRGRQEEWSREDHLVFAAAVIINNMDLRCCN